MEHGVIVMQLGLSKWQALSEQIWRVGNFAWQDNF